MDKEISRNPTPILNTESVSFELTSSSDSAPGEVYSDTKLDIKTKKNESKRSQRIQQSEQNETTDSEVEETENKNESNALKNFAEVHFGKSKAKLIRQTELEDDVNEDLYNKRKVRMKIKQEHISTSNELSEKSIHEDEEAISTPMPKGSISPFETPKSNVSPFQKSTSKQRKRTPMVMPGPQIKAKSKVSTIEAISEGEPESETEQLEPYQKLKYLEDDDMTSEFDKVSITDELIPII